MSSLNKLYRAENNRRLNNATLGVTEKQKRMCLSKLGFDTGYEAERAALLFDQRAYSCDYCAHYHLTSQLNGETE